MDPDSAIFVIDLQDANKTQILFKKNFRFLLFAGTFTSNPDEDPYLWLMDPYPDPGGPKT